MNTDHLLAWLDGTLPPEERRAMEARLAASPALRAELDELRAMRGLMQTATQHAAEDALKPFFADRLMRRIGAARARVRRAPDEEVFMSLVRLFRPVAVAGLVLILVFAAYNLTLADDYGVEQSTTEAVLALPPVSIATAYDAGY